MSGIQHIKSALDDARAGLESLSRDEAKLTYVAEAARTMSESLKAKGRIFSCGNGGSMCDAMHFAEELT